MMVSYIRRHTIGYYCWTLLHSRRGNRQLDAGSYAVMDDFGNLQFVPRPCQSARQTIEDEEQGVAAQADASASASASACAGPRAARQPRGRCADPAALGNRRAGGVV